MMRISLFRYGVGGAGVTRGLVTASRITGAPDGAAQEAAHEVARDLLAQGEYREAHRVSRDALEEELEQRKTSSAVQPSKTLPLLTLEMAKSLQKLNESAAAEKAFQGADILFQLSDDDYERHVETLLHHGKLCSMKANYEEAEHILKRAISLCLRRIGKENEYNVLSMLALGDLYLEKRQVSEALRYAIHASEIAKVLGSKQRMCEAISLHGLCKVQSKEFKDAIELFKEAREHLQIDGLKADEMSNTERVNAWNLSKNLEFAYDAVKDKEAAMAENLYRQSFQREVNPEDGERVITDLKDLQ